MLPPTVTHELEIFSLGGTDRDVWDLILVVVLERGRRFFAVSDEKRVVVCITAFPIVLGRRVPMLESLEVAVAVGVVCCHFA